jgi:cytoskeletal protein CcmA (bactofilin family)
MSGIEQSTGANGANDATVVGRETTIEGKIYSKVSLRVEGRVEGEVYSDDTVVVGSGGEVDGNIEAQTIMVGGKVEGNVRASDKLEILPQGHVTGDVFTPFGRLVIEEGARLEGKCAMTKEVTLDKGGNKAKVVDASSSKESREKVSESGA